MYYTQQGYDIRCEWGINGVTALSSVCDVMIIVDVLSFSTCVCIGAEKGADIYPYRFRDESSIDFAEKIGAKLAQSRRLALENGGISLSPCSLMQLSKNDKVVLPSPNGATLSLAANDNITLAGCLRNAGAVAQVAQSFGKKIGIVPCGERWHQDNSLRPAIEDFMGAGAIIHGLSGKKSPEAQLAESAFLSTQHALLDTLYACGSGIQLIEQGYESDVMIAGELNISQAVPIMNAEGAYVCKNAD